MVKRISNGKNDASLILYNPKNIMSSIHCDKHMVYDTFSIFLYSWGFSKPTKIAGGLHYPHSLMVRIPVVMDLSL